MSTTHTNSTMLHPTLQRGLFFTGPISLKKIPVFLGTLRPLTTRTAAAAASNASSSPQHLVHWVLENGGKVDGIHVHKWSGADGGSGFGLQATTTVAPGHPLITLPPQCLLTYTPESTDPMLMDLINKVPGELWGGKLALSLLAHRALGEESRFSSYVDNLPLGFPGLPMFFDGPTVAALEYPPVTEQVKKRCRWLIGFANEVLAPIKGVPGKDCFGGAALDANTLGWALGAVTSRAFRIGGPSRPAALLPLIDMANHSYTPNAKIVPGGTISGTSSGKGGSGGSSSALCMVATSELSPGDPVLISYGNLPNDFLLLDYGFLVPRNPYDTVQLRFDPGLVEAAKSIAGVVAGSSTGKDVDAGLVLPSWQKKALTGLKLLGPDANTEVALKQVFANTSSSSSEEESSNQECPVDWRLLAGVRVLCASNAAQLQDRSPEDLGKWDAPLSPSNETATLKTLTGLAAIALSQFSGTLADDEALLKQGFDAKTGQVLSEDMQLAIRFRAEKKRLLLAGINAMSERLKQVKNLSFGTSESGKGKKGVKNVTGKGFGK